MGGIKLIILFNYFGGLDINRYLPTLFFISLLIVVPTLSLFVKSG